MTTTAPVGRTARGLRASVAGSMAGKAAELVTLLALATFVPRVLGPSDYGRFSVPLTIVTVGSLALTLGGPTVMARFVPAAPAHQRVALARALGLRLARGRAAQLALVAGAGTAAMVLDPQRFAPFATTVVLSALALNVAATLALQVGLGLGRTGAWSARYPLQNAVLIAAVLLLHDVAGANGTIAALLVSAVVAVALGTVVVAPVLAEPSRRVDVPAGAIRFGVLHAAGAALVQITHRGGVLAVAILAGSTVETGYAALAIGIALGVTYAVLQAFTVSLPHLGGIGSDHDDGEAVLRRLAGGLLLALVPGALVAAALVDRLLPSVFGPGYAGADGAFGPALALMVLAPLNALAVQVSALRLRPEASLASGIASAATFVVVAVVAVPAWGATGGTTAALAGAAAGAVTSIRYLPGAVGGRIAASTAMGVAAVLLAAELA